MFDRSAETVLAREIPVISRNDCNPAASDKTLQCEETAFKFFRVKVTSTAPSSGTDPAYSEPENRRDVSSEIRQTVHFTALRVVCM
jgi:hypothetical protein